MSHVDVAPTLLELAGLPPLGSASGVSLASQIRGGEAPPARVLYAETKRELSAYRGTTEVRVRAGSPQPGSGLNENPIRLDADLRWRAFQHEGASASGQRVDLPLASEAAAALEQEVRAYLVDRVPTAAALRFSKDEVQRLRALGYLPGD